MAEIEDCYYDISDLVRTWDKQGWTGLAAIGDKIRARDDMFGNRKLCVTHRIRNGLHDVLGDLRQELEIRLPDANQLIALSLIPHDMPYPKDEQSNRVDLYKYLYQWKETDEGGTKRDDARRAAAMKEVLKALCTRKTFREAFEHISTSIIRENFVKYEHYNIEDWRVPIGLFWREVFGHLLNGLKSSDACEEAYWNCVWLYANDTITLLQDALQKIECDTPITFEQSEELENLLSWGVPDGRFVSDDSGRMFYKIRLNPMVPAFDKYGLESSGLILCVQPAFVIAQRLQSVTSKGRFCVICLAPSCHKTFWTGRANAKVCPGSRGNRKNACSLEWIRYRRWLLKTGRDPETDWADTEAQRLFLHR